MVDASEESKCKPAVEQRKNVITEPIRGVIYLSRIPKFMRVKKIRELFSVYGEVDRIFLQPDGTVNWNEEVWAIIQCMLSIDSTIPCPSMTNDHIREQMCCLLLYRPALRLVSWK